MLTYVTSILTWWLIKNVSCFSWSENSLKNILQQFCLVNPKAELHQLLLPCTALPALMLQCLAGCFGVMTFPSCYHMGAYCWWYTSRTCELEDQRASSTDGLKRFSEHQPCRRASERKNYKLQQFSIKTEHRKSAKHQVIHVIHCSVYKMSEIMFCLLFFIKLLLFYAKLSSWLTE